jgi:hypothetical protein
MAKNRIKIGDSGIEFIEKLNDLYDFTQVDNIITESELTLVSGNTYVITKDINIDTLTVPENCILRFDGGKFTKNGAGIINFEGEILIESRVSCLFGDIKITTTNGAKIINSDWFDLEKQSPANYNAKSLAETTKNNTFLSNHNNFTICWGFGIYVFSAASNNLSQSHIGKGRYLTCLHFPNSGAFYYSTNKSRLTYKDIYIHSKEACWKVECDIPYAVSIIKHHSVTAYSEEDFIYQLALGSNAPIYHCEWIDFAGGCGNTEKGIFYRFGTTSNIMDHIWNTPDFFTGASTTGKFKAVFFDCHTSIMKNSSFCYGQFIDHIYYRTGTVSNNGIWIDWYNNHFEDVQGELISIPSNAITNGSIHMRCNNKSSGFVPNGNPVLKIARCRLRQYDGDFDFNSNSLLFVEIAGDPTGNAGYFKNYTNFDVLCIDNYAAPYAVYFVKGNQNGSGRPIKIKSSLTFPDFNITVRPDNGQPREIYEIIYMETPSACTTANLPTLTSADMGFKLFDTTRNKEVLWNGMSWVNVDGTSLT